MSKISTWKHFKFNPNSVNFSCDTSPAFNEFDILLRCEWERAVSQGLFAFPIDHGARHRILEDGDLNCIVELNAAREEKRRAPYPFEHVNIPFDNKKFNFNKIKDEEILFSLDDEQYIDKYLVIINNAPIRPYHVLLVPDRQLESPQVATIDSIVFGFEFVASSAHPYLLAGLNSLCAYASVNHLHLHGMYMPNRLFAQTIECSPFHAKTNCYLSDSFETQAFAFEAKHPDEFIEIARYVYIITNYLTTNDIAHNVAIMKGNSFSSTDNVLRIFIWFRQSIMNGKRFDRCNFACIELSGYMPTPSEEVYNTLTESELLEHMNALALSPEKQQQIKNDIKHLLDE